MPWLDARVRPVMAHNVPLSDAPVMRVTAHEIPLPDAPQLEDFVLPRASDIVRAARWVAAY